MPERPAELIAATADLNAALGAFVDASDRVIGVAASLAQHGKTHVGASVREPAGRPADMGVPMSGQQANLPAMQFRFWRRPPSSARPTDPAVANPSIPHSKASAGSPFLEGHQ